MIGRFLSTGELTTGEMTTPSRIGRQASVPFENAPALLAAFSSKPVLVNLSLLVMVQPVNSGVVAFE
ncbi:MAG: hypothetical protein IV100_04165 [Myxococcales bacterium]|nr:hypothetical protein [Myxococcales bacterium]